MLGVLGVLGGIGLAAAAGLNAYLPVLLIGLLARFTATVPLDGAYQRLAEPGVLAALTALLAVETVVDKIPGADRVNDAVQTAVRAASGGLVFTAAATVLGSGPALPRPAPWIGWLVGGVIALAVHTVKATTRPVLRARAGAAVTPVASCAEDVAAIGFAVAAVFAPPVAAAAVLVLLGAATWWVRWTGRLRRARGGGSASPPAGMPPPAVRRRYRVRPAGGPPPATPDDDPGLSNRPGPRSSPW